MVGRRGLTALSKGTCFLSQLQAPQVALTGRRLGAALCDQGHLQGHLQKKLQIPPTLAPVTWALISLPAGPLQVLHDSQQAYKQLAAAQARGALCDPTTLASQLAARGHRVVLRQAKGSITSQPQDSSSYFSSLSHSFLLVAPRFGAAAGRPCSQLPQCGVCPPGGCGCQLIVDPNFGSQFEVPRCTPRYQALVEQLPPVFVGPACQLAHLVDWVSR